MLHYLTCWFVLAACRQVFSFVEEEPHLVNYAEIDENFFSHYDEQTVFPTEIHYESPYLTSSFSSPSSSSSSSSSSYEHAHSRPKRSTSSNVRERRFKEFAFRGFNEYFHLELKPEDDLLAPGFKVYHLNNGISQKVDEGVDDLKKCLFSGKLRHQPLSSLALNLCGGMSGFIRTESAEYLIEPSNKNITDEKATTRSHVLKRRSIEKSRKRKTEYKQSLQTHFCGKRRRYMPHKPRRKDHWLPDEFPAAGQKSPPSRTKRWAPKEDRKRQHPRRHKRSVETLVVADREMVRKHGTENVTTYLLTVFNMVSMLYQDSSIDSNVSVILVGLVLLEGDEPGLTLSHNAERSLSSFCQWQSTIHTSRGRQHDHAVLVTGLDICSWKDEPCDTLGYAPISGMCSKYRSCTVNEDSGLALAFTVAHEIGHNFGMLHDGQGSSPCRKGRGTIMSASLSGLDTSVLWSECSRRDLAHFLQSPRSQCLQNEPKSPGELQFPNHLPGQLYDADMQCRLQFGNKSKLCSHYPRKNEVCRSLWCQRNGRECETKFLPAAEGTTCGKNQWCRKGACIDKDSETLTVVDGGWGEFSDWSNCSRSCDGGLMSRERFCDSPEPQNGGNYCKGEEKEYQICGTRKCEPDNPEYLTDQCSTFNKRTVKGKLYKWKPYGKDLGALSRCRIYCVPDKEDLYLVLSTKLQDGTSCSGNFSGVCIDGECRSVGCDGKVDSTVNPDYCGVCNGDNSTCQTVRGTFHAMNLSAGYHEVVRIPASSRHLHISEAREASPYLALKDASGQFRLNGNWVLDWPGRYEAAGTVFSYRRWPGKSESLVAKGPTTEELIVEVLVQDNEEAVINYKFVVAYKKPEWKYQNSSCSATCGNGIYTANPVCIDAAGKVINETNCDISTKFISLTYPCQVASCPARWHTGEWSPCDPYSCETSWQNRAVYCAVGQKEISKAHCAGLVRPDDTRQCSLKNCTYMWFTGPWSKCRGICSNGFQTRSVTCRKNANGTAESFSNCDHHAQPPHMRKCKSENCSTDQQNGEAIWISGPWSQCNTECGYGNQTRNVSCIKKLGGILQTSNACDYRQKPSTKQTCITGNCNETKPPDCADYYEWCPSSTNDRLCKLKFYATNCCKTCRNIF